MRNAYIWVTLVYFSVLLILSMVVHRQDQKNNRFQNQVTSMVVHKQEQKFDAERAENRHFQHQLVPSKLHREENVNQKAFSLLITMRVSKRGNSYNHAKVSVAAIRSVFPKAKLLLFSDEYVPFLHNDIINHGDNWTKLVLGKIPRHHNDSWKRIQWRTAICSDFMQIIEKIGDFEEDLLLWVEDT